MQPACTSRVTMSSSDLARTVSRAVAPLPKCSVRRSGRRRAVLGHQLAKQVRHFLARLCPAAATIAASASLRSSGADAHGDIERRAALLVSHIELGTVLSKILDDQRCVPADGIVDGRLTVRVERVQVDTVLDTQL